ncbi:hypothetical protein [Burkholderia stagnalis]|uniref:hypothetical protein n=1 Tax=Burkholderia stagnalis TaxID=1503054 RepID=UPI00075F7E79|nr:hypothetical protein [Burkholderia stagnalis]KWN65897.1 hypothetical protein WT90_32915 [Burkholderia stagnalis]
MTDALQLVASALLPTFPPGGAQFMRDCLSGLTKRKWLAHTRARGFAPTWRPLTRDGLEAFGFGLTVDGCVVPLIARMHRAGESMLLLAVPTRDPRQLSLL